MKTKNKCKINHKSVDFNFIYFLFWNGFRVLQILQPDPRQNIGTDYELMYNKSHYSIDVITHHKLEHSEQFLKIPGFYYSYLKIMQ